MFIRSFLLALFFSFAVVGNSVAGNYVCDAGYISIGWGCLNNDDWSKFYDLENDSGVPTDQDGNPYIVQTPGATGYIVPAPPAPPAPQTAADLVGGIDFAGVALAILAVCASVVVVFVFARGAQFVLAAVRRS